MTWDGYVDVLDLHALCFIHLLDCVRLSVPLSSRFIIYSRVVGERPYQFWTVLSTVSVLPYRIRMVPPIRRSSRASIGWYYRISSSCKLLLSSFAWGRVSVPVLDGAASSYHCLCLDSRTRAGRYQQLHCIFRGECLYQWRMALSVHSSFVVVAVFYLSFWCSRVLIYTTNDWTRYMVYRRVSKLFDYTLHVPTSYR